MPVCSSLGVVPGPASRPFCPPVLCTHSPSCPQIQGCVDKSMSAVTVEKIKFLQSGAATPRLATVCPTLLPLPLANTWCCTFAEPLFGVSVVGGEGPATPDQERAHLCARTTGSLNALKSCSVLSTVRPGPPQPGAFGPSLHGDVVSSRDSRPLHPPTARDGEEKRAGWRPGDVTTRGGGGTQGYCKYLLPLLRSLP